MLQSYIDFLKKLLTPSEGVSIPQYFTALGLGYRVLLMFVVIAMFLGSILVIPKKVVAKLTVKDLQVIQNAESTSEAIATAMSHMRFVTIAVWGVSLFVYVPALIPTVLVLFSIF